MNKRGASALVPVIVVILVILWVFFIYLGYKSPQITGSAVDTGTANKNCHEVQVPYETTEEYVETVPYTAEECDDVPIKYLLEWGTSDRTCLNEICDEHESYCAEKNFWGNCIRFEEKCTHNACTKYTEECSLKIENIDDEAGTWGISASFWDNDNNKKGDLVETVRTFVNPTKSSIASWSYTYDSGENKRCYYTISEVPTKSVCGNVIRDKEVTKTRPVVRYKTETKCD